MKNLAALVFVPPQNVIEELTRIKKSTSEVLDGKSFSYSSCHFILYFEFEKIVNHLRSNVLARYSRTLYIRVGKYHALKRPHTNDVSRSIVSNHCLIKFNFRPIVFSKGSV